MLTSIQKSTALKSIRSLAPLLDRVLVQRIKAETKTASGLFLPESAVKDLNEAKVLAVGPGGLDKSGNRVACSVKAGDKVLIPQVCDECSFSSMGYLDWVENGEMQIQDESYLSAWITRIH